MILFNQGVRPSRLDLALEMERQFVPDEFRANHNFMVQLVQMCLQNLKLRLKCAFYGRLEELMGQV